MLSFVQRLVDWVGRWFISRCDALANDLNVARGIVIGLVFALFAWTVILVLLSL